MAKKIEFIINCFLKEFELQWNAIMNELEVKQGQLSNGSRLRPQLCLWGYLATFRTWDQLTTKHISHITSISISVEMIHKASILIDDWIDDDQTRHGNLAFHVEYSPQEAVLVALNMIGYAMNSLKRKFQGSSALLPGSYLMCLDVLLDIIYSMAQGALKELQLQGDDFFDSSKIKEIMHLETAKMIENSLLLGYYAGTFEGVYNPDIESILKQIGDQCGFLFQAMNDLEAFSSPVKLYSHKSSLNFDILNGRKNLGVSTLYELATPTDKKLLLQSMSDNLLPLMKKYHVIDIISKQSMTIYRNVIKQIEELSSYGLSKVWCEEFKNFWEYVKECEEERLKA